MCRDVKGGQLLSRQESFSSNSLSSNTVVPQCVHYSFYVFVMRMCFVILYHSRINPRHFDFAGIGFNVVYQLTDCPILLSDHKDICMFDPHLRYVPGACDERPGGHVDLKQDANFAKIFPDFMAGFLSTCFPYKLKLLAICCIF